VIAFDVNETLLDLSALDPLFERAFGDASLRPLWFAQMLQLAFVGVITGNYIDFGTAQRAALTMVAQRTGTDLEEQDADEIVGAMSSLPPHPEVREALQRLHEAGLSRLTSSAESTCSNRSRRPAFEICASATSRVEFVNAASRRPASCSR